MERLCIAYGGRHPVSILDDAWWSLPAGAQVALCGPSGSGKSTLLFALAGIESQESGAIWWDDIRLNTLGTREREAWRRRELGMVFQAFHLFPRLTALDNVILPATFGAMRVAREERERARVLLDEVGVAPGRACALLSRGEQQRVAIVRAVCRRPRVVLADEPTACLDSTAATRAHELLRALCRESGATLIVATHDARLASRLDDAYVLADGRVGRQRVSLGLVAAEAAE
jgi:putative ABC transport system ATP-binding protein